ncbi:uncharacterized protein LOC113146605 [Cyclospora cayetanensis]|uniref:Uncharacterized protein LOC113146605 n=1 Tax=Cyclospora cayetanensis TaxID=88456 RepID=A0A6P6RR46_9EIME|nr:uncharacterized protein LOC113146605 [Cyclospora cayetanensis]
MDTELFLRAHQGARVGVTARGPRRVFTSSLDHLLQAASLPASASQGLQAQYPPFVPSSQGRPLAAERSQTRLVTPGDSQKKLLHAGPSYLAVRSPHTSSDAHGKTATLRPLQEPTEHLDEGACSPQREGDSQAAQALSLSAASADEALESPQAFTAPSIEDDSLWEDEADCSGGPFCESGGESLTTPEQTARGGFEGRHLAELPWVREGDLLLRQRRQSTTTQPTGGLRPKSATKEEEGEALDLGDAAEVSVPEPHSSLVKDAKASLAPVDTDATKDAGKTLLVTGDSYKVQEKSPASPGSGGPENSAPPSSCETPFLAFPDSQEAFPVTLSASAGKLQLRTAAEFGGEVPPSETVSPRGCSRVSNPWSAASSNTLKESPRGCQIMKASSTEDKAPEEHRLFSAETHASTPRFKKWATKEISSRRQDAAADSPAREISGAYGADMGSLEQRSEEERCKEGQPISAARHQSTRIASTQEPGSSALVESKKTAEIRSEESLSCFSIPVCSASAERPVLQVLADSPRGHTACALEKDVALSSLVSSPQEASPKGLADTEKPFCDPPNLQMMSSPAAMSPRRFVAEAGQSFKEKFLQHWTGDSLQPVAGRIEGRTPSVERAGKNAVERQDAAPSSAQQQQQKRPALQSPSSLANKGLNKGSSWGLPCGRRCEACIAEVCDRLLAEASPTEAAALKQLTSPNRRLLSGEETPLDRLAEAGPSVAATIMRLVSMSPKRSGQAGPTSSLAGAGLATPVAAAANGSGSPKKAQGRRRYPEPQNVFAGHKTARCSEDGVSERMCLVLPAGTRELLWMLSRRPPEALSEPACTGSLPQGPLPKDGVASGVSEPPGKAPPEKRNPAVAVKPVTRVTTLKGKDAGNFGLQRIKKALKPSLRGSLPPSSSANKHQKLPAKTPATKSSPAVCTQKRREQVGAPHHEGSPAHKRAEKILLSKARSCPAVSGGSPGCQCEKSLFPDGGGSLVPSCAPRKQQSERLLRGNVSSHKKRCVTAQKVEGPSTSTATSGQLRGKKPPWDFSCVLRHDGPRLPFSTLLRGQGKRRGL